MRGRRVVGSVAALIALIGCGRKEDDLKTRVEAHLRQEQSTPQVQVYTHEHIVVLTGVARSEAERMRIEESVRTVPGVLSVDNRLVVQQPPVLTAATDEARLGATIQSRLDQFRVSGVRVDVANGVVRLSGDVDRRRHDEVMRIVLESLPDGYRIDDATTLR